MAGIAFDIRKLMGRGNITSVIAAFFYSGIVSSGHWLFAVFSMSILTSIGRKIVPPEVINQFMGIVVYSFSFALILTYGSQMIITRLLADELYRENEEIIPSLLTTALLLGTILVSIPGIPFIYFMELSVLNKWLSYYLLVLTTAMGIAMIFVSTLKAYLQVFLAFLSGFTVAVPVALVIGSYWGLSGFLAGMGFGISLVVFFLCSRVLVEFEGKIQLVTDLIPLHFRYRKLFLYGLFTGLGVWIDKLVLWWVHKVPVGGGLYSFPFYDGAMFLGYLTSLPALAVFVLQSETELYENVRKYSYFVNQHGNLHVLEQLRVKTKEALQKSFVHLGVFQGIISFTAFIFSPQIIHWAGMSEAQIPVLRIAILGAYFQMGMMLFSIVLTYYNGQKEMFHIAWVFCLLNFAGSWGLSGVIELSGYGFFTASIFGFVLSAFFLYYKFKNLHFSMIAAPEKI